MTCSRYTLCSNSSGLLPWFLILLLIALCIWTRGILPTGVLRAIFNPFDGSRLDVGTILTLSDAVLGRLKGSSRFGGSMWAKFGDPYEGAVEGRIAVERQPGPVSLTVLLSRGPLLAPSGSDDGRMGRFIGNSGLVVPSFQSRSDTESDVPGTRFCNGKRDRAESFQNLPWIC